MNKKIYTVAGSVAVAALLGIVGIYELSSENQANEQLTQESTQTAEENGTQSKEENTAQVSTGKIQNEESENQDSTEKKVEDTQPAQTEEETEQNDEAANVTATSASLNEGFSESSVLKNPVEGDVLLAYSMDKSVYFSTLDQYKYNPAVLLSAQVNESVFSAAAGTIVSVDTDEEIGNSVTVDLGNGYKAVYGQLKEVQVAVDDYVSEGALIGYVSEPTKYYLKEGTNLYFELLLNEKAIDPMTFMQ